MERRRVALGAIGVVVMLVTAGLVLHLAQGGGDDVGLDTTPSSIDALSGDGGDLLPGQDILPGDPPSVADPSLAADAAAPVATLPPAGVPTIPFPDLATATTGAGPATTRATTGAAFPESGVWVIRTDGSSPILVARGATSGVAAGGTWVAFVQGTTVQAAKRSDLQARRDLATGVTGAAAQGLPISGGKRGVAFLQGGKAVLVDPAAPGQPVASFDGPGADAVAAEEDGEGRLVWADAGGLHVGAAETVAGADHVQRGMLVMGHGILAHLEVGQVTIRGGPRLAWGDIDRLQTGAAGIVAASSGRIRFHTRAGDDRVFLDGASTPVVTTSRIVYVSEARALVSASLTGTGVTVVATAEPGRAITNLDLLDDTTLVVTVA